MTQAPITVATTAATKPAEVVANSPEEAGTRFAPARSSWSSGSAPLIPMSGIAGTSWRMQRPCLQAVSVRMLQVLQVCPLR